MAEPHARVDKPEPRWQALLAMAAVGGVYLALPRELVIGPTWLMPTVIAFLLAPTIVTHRMGKHSFNHALGIVNNGIITAALIGSVILLVRGWHRTERSRCSSYDLVPSFGSRMFSSSRSGIGGSTAAARTCATSIRNSEAAVSYFRKCRSKKASVNDLASNTGGRVLSIIFLSHSRKALPSDQPMLPCWLAG
jgi:hypothetical protein